MEDLFGYGITDSLSDGIISPPFFLPLRYSIHAVSCRRKQTAMNKKVLILLGITGLLTGCVTMTPEQRRAADEQTCQSYGFKPRTDAFANCLMRLDLDRRADRRVWQNQVDFYDAPMVIYRPVYRP